jgi:hypothetical protein
MPQLIKDNLPLMEVLNGAQAKAARNHGIPLFKGKLFSHKGTLDQNLDKYGRPIFEFVNENTVVIGGAVLALEKLFYGNDTANTDIGFMPLTLNQQFNLNTSVNYSDSETKIALFGCGIGGSDLEWGSVNDPDFKMYNLGNPIATDQSINATGGTWLPFRVSTSVNISPDETGAVPTNYFFRKPIVLNNGANNGYAWYLKEISNTPVVPIKSLWQDTLDPTDDGTEITGSTLSDSQKQRTDLIECFGECMLTITEDDFREYFVAAGNLTNARFNQIGLFTGVKKQIDGSYYDYVGVRLFSVVNFNNVSVQEPSTNVYLYRIYSAV